MCVCEKKTCNLVGKRLRNASKALVDKPDKVPATYNTISYSYVWDFVVQRFTNPGTK